MSTSLLKKIFSFDRKKDAFGLPAADAGQDPTPTGEDRPSDVANRPISTQEAQQAQEEIGIFEPSFEACDGASSSADAVIGKTLAGRYEITGLIGKGGMGRVYTAHQQAVDRTVAVKVLNAEMSTNPEQVSRFRQEALAASQLSHPNTITIHDFGYTDENILYIVMEYLSGHPLGQLFGTAPNPRRILKIILQICGSLEEAHRQGIVHQDLKPANIFLNKMGRQKDFVKVLDFGISKIVMENANTPKGGMIFGTPRYMSPEQIRGDHVDQSADIYSLGVLMYELLSGRLLYGNDTPISYFYNHVNTVPTSLLDIRCPHRISKALANTVMKMLEKKPSDRYPEIETLISVLIGVLKSDYEQEVRRVAKTPFTYPKAQSIPANGVSPERRHAETEHPSKKSDEVSILKTLAQLYENDGTIDKAVEVYERIAKIELEKGLYGHAATTLSKLLSMDETHVRAKFQLGRCYGRIGETDHAVRIIKEVCRVFEASNDKENLEASLRSLKSLYEEVGDKDGAGAAETRLKRLLIGRKLQDTSPAKHRRGILSGATPKARVTAVDGVSSSDSPERRLSALIRARRFQPALKVVRKALIADPQNQETLAAAAVIMEKGWEQLSPDERTWLQILLPRNQDERNEKKTGVNNRVAGPTFEELLERADMVVVDGMELKSAYADGTFDIPKFAISRTLVTNAQYSEYVQAEGEVPPSDWYGPEPRKEQRLLPVTRITLKQAAQYAAWRGLKLPTLLEWELASKGDGNTPFPWGNAFDPTQCHCPESGADGPCPVTEHQQVKSRWGCVDMVGNVWEWTSPDPRLPPPETGYTWVIGGSYRHPCAKASCIARNAVFEESAYAYLGFRCALS